MAKILIIQLFDETYGSAVLNYIGSAHDAKTCFIVEYQYFALIFIQHSFLSDSAFGSSSQFVCPMTEAEMQSLNSAQLSKLLLQHFCCPSFGSALNGE
jgi:hypothetical protein